jgi:hypothetical protein
LSGLFNKDRSESDGEYFNRIFKWLQNVSNEALKKANFRICRLSKALAVVNQQLEKERERTRLYQQIAPDPQELIDKVLNTEKKEIQLASKEASLDFHIKATKDNCDLSIKISDKKLAILQSANVALKQENNLLKLDLNNLRKK